MLTDEQLYQLSLKVYRDNQNAIEYMLRKGEEKGLKKGMKQGLQQGKKQGLQQGLKQGYQKGMEQARLESAKGLKRLNVPIEQIMEITKLTREEIEKL